MRLSARTNRIIGGAAPSKYLPLLVKQAEITPQELDEILTTHSVDPTAMREDDFDAFFEARGEALLSVIAEAMGKDVIRLSVEGGETPDMFVEEPDEPDEPEGFPEEAA